MTRHEEPSSATNPASDLSSDSVRSTPTHPEELSHFVDGVDDELALKLELLFLDGHDHVPSLGLCVRCHLGKRVWKKLVKE